MASIRNPSENLETYCLIWLDSYVNSSSDNRQAQVQLKKIIHHLLTFDDDQQCLQYLANLSENNRVILIVSGRFGRSIVPRLIHHRQITSIYIYCMDKRVNEQWSKGYLKVKKVVTYLNELIRLIEEDYFQQQDYQFNECLPMKIDDGKSDEFLRFQLLIDGLIRLKSFGELEERFDLISFCKKYYQTNSSELVILKEFQSTYQANCALSWFTRRTFISRLLIRAFRDENLDLLCKLRFFLRHLAYQLGQTKPTTSIRVYRSQLMSKDEFNLLKNSLGKLISFNSFLRANYDEQFCRSLLIGNFNLEKVLFEIHIDSNLSHLRSFGNIQMKNKEILFMIGSIFSIDEIHNETVKLTLRSLDYPPLESLAQQMKNELSIGQLNRFQFGKLLYRIGKFDLSRKYFCQYLNQLPDNHAHISICYQHLGLLSERKKNFPLSLKWYKRAVKTCEQTHAAEIYNSMGDVYAKINDYERAIKTYEKAISHLEDNPRLTIKYLNNLGAVYDMQKNYTQALECYERALTISKQIDDSSTIFILKNIGNSYELNQDYKQAIKSYLKAWKIINKSSIIDKIYIKDLQTSLKRVSIKQNR